MFTVVAFLKYLLGRTWPMLVGLLVIALVFSASSQALIAAAILLGFVAMREIYAYVVAFEKHHELKAKYGDSYSRHLENYLRSSTLSGYVNYGWVAVEHELKAQAKSSND